jgi:hypothetical protein
MRSIRSIVGSMLGRFTVRPSETDDGTYGVWDGAVNGWRATRFERDCIWSGIQHVRHIPPIPYVLAHDVRSSTAFLNH